MSRSGRKTTLQYIAPQPNCRAQPAQSFEAKHYYIPLGRMACMWPSPSVQTMPDPSINLRRHCSSTKDTISSVLSRFGTPPVQESLVVSMRHVYTSLYQRMTAVLVSAVTRHQPISCLFPAAAPAAHLNTQYTPNSTCTQHGVAVILPQPRLASRLSTVPQILGVK
jgi:hypothetical protein